MSNLKERLRDLKERVYPDDLMEEAADEIGRLEDALQRVVDHQGSASYQRRSVYAIAKEALNKEQP